ncbi:glycoside hydrolase family 28 protein [Lacticaseibacillus sp. GG6-2]
MTVYQVTDFGASPDGEHLTTAAIQAAVDTASASGSVVHIPAGTYLTGAIFLHDHMTLDFAPGAKLVATTDIDQFPERFARVAGVEMNWPTAILNLFGLDDVTIQGPGVLDGSGPFWWNKYWGADQHGGLRADYDAKDLRWIADYDIKRVRTILAQSCHHLRVDGLTLQRAGFWNLQLTYCDDVEVTNLTINQSNGPSTDGIDVDSSTHVHIHDCTLACGDDCIAIKSGRDGDGLRVNKPTADVEIDHCHILSGYGVTIGSEVSGSIRRINIHDMQFDNSGCGFRMKSAIDRGGIIEDITVSNLHMVNVQFPFSWLLTWHNQYNHKTMVDLADKPASWSAVAAQIPEDQRITQVQNIHVQDVDATLTPDYTWPSRAFDLKALPEKPMKDVTFDHVRIQAHEFGHIVAVNGLQFNDVNVSVSQANTAENDDYDNR